MGQLLLVRHGQASWGAADYDVLSEIGHQQSRLLGESLVARGIHPDVVVTGSMRRHRETWESMAFAGAPEAEIDSGWDEFDHLTMLAAQPAPFEGHEPTAAQFQTWFEAATDRWIGGEFDGDYDEPFGVFTARVDAAVRRTAEAAGRGTAIVVTSGGPVSWALASLLTGSTTLWRSLNPVCVNSGVSKVVTGRRGLTAVSFNDHSHLEPYPLLFTYR